MAGEIASLQLQYITSPTKIMPYIIIQVCNSQLGDKLYTIDTSMKMIRLFNTYVHQLKIKIKTLVFSFDGRCISDTDTAQSLGLQEGSSIIDENIDNKSNTTPADIDTKKYLAMDEYF